MLVKHFKVVLPSVWAECKGLDPDAQPPADTNNTSIPVDVEAATNGSRATCTIDSAGPGWQWCMGVNLLRALLRPRTQQGTPPVGDRLETILEMLSNAPPVSNDGLPGGGGGMGGSQMGHLLRGFRAVLLRPQAQRGHCP